MAVGCGLGDAVGAVDGAGLGVAGAGAVAGKDDGALGAAVGDAAVHAKTAPHTRTAQSRAKAT